MKRVAVTLLLLCGSSATARGQAADFDPENRGWDGLSTLVSLADGLGIPLSFREELDWGELEPDDRLWILSPTRRIEAGQITAFLHSGGTLIVGDDFGTASETLARLGVLRSGGAPAGGNRYKNLPFAPVASPLDPDHPLAKNVPELVTNHPAILPRTDGFEMVFGFSPEQGVVSTGQVGAGRIVVLSDPSVLINRMLEFDGNLQFAENLLWFSGGRDSRIFVLTGPAGLTGAPGHIQEAHAPSARVQNTLFEFNRFLEELNEYVFTRPGLHIVGGLVIVAIAMLMMAALPLRQRYQQPERLFASPTTESLISPELALDAIGHSGQSGNFVLPAAALRDAVDGMLSRALGVERALYTVSAQNLLPLVERHAGPAARQATARLLPLLAEIPDKHQAALPWSTLFLSFKDFQATKREVERLVAALDR